MKEHSKEEVLQVIDWWLTSRHQRAVYVRENHSIDTLFRAKNFDAYLDFSSETELTYSEKLGAAIDEYVPEYATLMEKR